MSDAPEFKLRPEDIPTGEQPDGSIILDEELAHDPVAMFFERLLNRPDSRELPTDP